MSTSIYFLQYLRILNIPQNILIFRSVYSLTIRVSNKNKSNKIYNFVASRSAVFSTIICIKSRYIKCRCIKSCRYICLSETIAVSIRSEFNLRTDRPRRDTILHLYANATHTDFQRRASRAPAGCARNRDTSEIRRAARAAGKTTSYKVVSRARRSMPDSPISFPPRSCQSSLPSRPRRAAPHRAAPCVRRRVGRSILRATRR